MRMGIISILFCSCLLSLVSCEHKDLCYSHPHDQEVRILFDWSNIREENIPKVVAVVFRNEETNTVVEFALPPEGGIVMIPNGAYEFTAYNVGQYGNIFKETDAGKIVTTPVSRKLKGIYYEAPDFLCLENLRVALTDSETSRLITAKPIRRTARVDYRINGIERLEKADAIYAVLSGCSAELELYTGCCVERHEDGIQHNIVFEVDKWKQQGWFYMFGGGFTPENRRTSEHVHILSIYAVYKDNKYKKLDIDVTQQIHCENPRGLPMEDFSIVVDLNLAHPDGGDDTDDTEGFFDPEVEGWEDIEIDIPL